MLSDPQSWPRLPEQVGEWLAIQKAKSVIPKRDEMLLETFPRGERFYMVATRSRGGLRTRRWACC